MRRHQCRQQKTKLITNEEKISPKYQVLVQSSRPVTKLHHKNLVTNCLVYCRHPNYNLSLSFLWHFIYDMTLLRLYLTHAWFYRFEISRIKLWYLTFFYVKNWHWLASFSQTIAGLDWRQIWDLPITQKGNFRLPEYYHSSLLSTRSRGSETQVKESYKHTQTIVGSGWGQGDMRTFAF